MRITISYFEGFPELEAELAKYPQRARAERLRHLAAMGLSFMQRGRFPDIENLGSPAQTTDDKPVGESATKEVARHITKNVFNQAE